jgi:hypothetical protein
VQPQFDNNLLASFFMYAEHRTAQCGGAFQTLTMRLFPTVDSTLPAGWQSYSAPLKGWIYNSGVSGARVINEVSGGGFSAPLTRASGIHIDYPNGRVLVPTSLGTNLTLTGCASACEVNHYLPNETEEQLLTQGKFFVNPQNVYPLTASGAPPHAYATPAIFINPLQTRNEPFEFGGRYNTKTTISLTVLAETPFQLNAIFAIWRDARFQYFPLFETIYDPLDQWGDFKGGTGFNYLAYAATWGTPGNIVYIEDVHTAKVSDKVRMNPQLFAGIIDLDMSFVRQPTATSSIFG